jgi:hypothetical protein
MSCAGARGCSVDEQSRVIKCIRVHRRRESCAVRAAEDKRAMCVKAASETKERGRGEKKRSAREVVETASPRRKKKTFWRVPNVVARVRSARSRI